MILRQDYMCGLLDPNRCFHARRKMLAAVCGCTFEVRAGIAKSLCAAFGFHRAWYTRNTYLLLAAFNRP